MKRTKKFLIFALVLIFVRGCIAADFYSEPIRYWANNGTLHFNRLTGTVTGYHCWDSSSPHIEIIPEKIGGVKVSAIGKEAFCESYVDALTIPDTVKTIGKDAFYQCPANIYFCGSQEQWERVRKGNADFTNTVIHYDTIMYPTNDGNIVFDPKTGTIIGCDDDTTAVDIPASINNIPVIAIRESAFFDCDSLTSVTIPDSVTSIGEYAFSDCRSLASVTIPDSVTTIGDYAFSECDSLASITIPGSVTAIGDGAFKFGNGESYSIDNASNSEPSSSLTSVTILDGVTTIGNAAFFGCSSLTNITIPDSVATIGYDAFYACSSLTSITIPNNVIAIRDGAFSGCSSLTSITIPDSVTTIGYDAFGDCNSLTSVTIPDGVTEIGDYTFSGCNSLTSITIPDSMKTIGSSAFSHCDSLTSITIPDSVTNIGNSAFFDCDSLISITIPDSMKTIRDNAFSGCSSMTHIYYGGSQEQWKRIGKSNNDFNSAAIHFNETLYPTFGGNIYFDPQTSTVTGCHGEITVVDIPATINDVPVVAIGEKAFYNRDSLTSITIPDSVTSIGNSAFSHCDNLTIITIPDSVTSIGVQTFYGCSSLTSITIPDSVTTIDWNAFFLCNGLTDIYFGGSEEQWEQLDKVNNGFTSAVIHYGAEA